MADPVDPTLPGWARGAIAIIREAPVWQILTMLAAAIALWVQQHQQHTERIDETKVLQQETRENGEKLQKIEAKLPSRVYLGAAKE